MQSISWEYFVRKSVEILHLLPSLELQGFSILHPNAKINRDHRKEQLAASTYTLFCVSAFAEHADSGAERDGEPLGADRTTHHLFHQHITSC